LAGRQQAAGLLYYKGGVLKIDDMCRPPGLVV